MKVSVGVLEMAFNVQPPRWDRSNPASLDKIASFEVVPLGATWASCLA